MKLILRSGIIAAVLLASILQISCETTRTGPVTPVQLVEVEPAAPLVLKGSVRDGDNLSGISGARVLVNREDGTRVATIVTDVSGRYQLDVSSIEAAKLKVIANIGNYGSSKATAAINKTAYTARVPDLFISRIGGTAVSVNAASGAELTHLSAESITGEQLTTVIAPNALTQNTSVKIAYVPTSNVIDLESSNQLLAAVGSFEPTGTTFNQPATVVFPLPHVTAAGKSLTHLRLNETNMVWEVQDNATVNPDGSTANITLSGFSFHALADAGSIVLSGADSSQADGGEVLVSEGGSSTHTFTPTLTVNTGNELSAVWLKNKIAEFSTVRVNGSGNPLPMTISTGEAIEPPLPAERTKTGTDGTVYYYNPERPDEAGVWRWQGIYQRFFITQSVTVTLGERTATATLTLKEYRKVGDSYLWVPSHNQGG